jgi:hypothetical protein
MAPTTFPSKGATVRKRWAGLATTIAVLSSFVALNGIVESAKADSNDGQTWTLFAAGDIATSANNGGADEANAALIKAGIAADPDHTLVAMLGDGAYPDGSYQTYLDQYDKTNGANDGWGQFKDKTYPAPGNHDYGQQMSLSDAGYRQYWGPILQAVNGDHGETSGDTLKDTSGWYSVDIGPSWHLISLNWACTKSAGTNASAGGSQSGCSETDPQGQWLAGDLARANAAHKHIVAMWHGARFVSGNEDPNGQIAQASSDWQKTNAYWGMLHKAGADIVLAGHHHLYERFDHMSEASSAPGDHQGSIDPTGPVSFVVGTGGGAPATFCGEAGTTCPTDTARGSVKQIDHQFGVLKLVLHPNSYEFQFLAAGTGQVLDQSDAPQPTLATFSPDGTTDTTVTTQPGGTTPTSGPAPAPGPHGGYWMVGADGKVYAFGAALKYGDAGLTPGTEAVDLEPTPSGNGYWVVDDAGGVSSFGDAVYHGAPDSVTLRPGEQVTSLSSTPSGQGYWMFTDKGRVLPYGDAVSYGDMANTKLNAPVLDSIVTPSGKGYYMVAADGGIFSFGDAKFYGSMGGKKLNAPVQSLVPDGDGVGYWLVASDGGIFAFDAPFKGSMGGQRLNKPITGMVRHADGYLMVGEDGGIFNFSSQKFLGSLGGSPPARPIVSVAALG